MNGQPAQQDFQIYLARRTFDPGGEFVMPPPDKPAAWYIVQFVKPLGPEERERLRSQHGLRLEEYVPNFAFLELLSPQRWDEIRNDPLYRASALYRPTDKISPHIEGTQSLLASDGSSVEGLLLRAVLFPNVDPQSVVEVINRINEEDRRRDAGPSGAGAVERERRESDASPLEAVDEPKVFDDREIGGQLQIVFVLPSADSLPRIAGLDEVRWVEEIVRAIPAACSDANLVAGTIQSGDPGVTPFWARCIKGTDQRIGIIDHELPDLTHCMFRDVNVVEPGQSHRKFLGFRGVGLSPNAHGTRVASIAAGDDINQSGMSPSRGVAWAARLSFDDLHLIFGHRKTMIEVLTDQMRLDSATIHSNSWSDPTPVYNQTANDVDSFAWRNEDHFVCGATGNLGRRGRRSDPLGPPGIAKNALCVSASRSHPNQLDHGDGVSGPTPPPDGRFKPEICAPGCGINVATTSSMCQCDLLSDCATSWATPVVAGAAALARQYFLEGWYRTGVKGEAPPHTPTAALLKATLLNSTVKMNGTSTSPYPSRRTGWGLLKLDNTLFFAGGARRLFFADVRNANGLQTGGLQTHRFNVQSDGQPLKVTLVWTDPPPLNSVGPALVNNLDLVVISPGGQTLRGNNFVEGVSVEGGQPDFTNNVEMVVVTRPLVGEWIVRVEATLVASDSPQGYALVVSADLTP